MSMTLKIYLETYGCSFNQASSEIIQGILENKYQLIASLHDADIIILNTCIVKTNTEAKILGKIKTYSEIFPDKGLLVAGCMPEAMSEKILQINPKISMIGPHFVTDVMSAVDAIADHKQFIELGKRKEIKVGLPRKFQDPLIAIIQIAQGCLNTCSYCITKQAMGSLQSYPVEQLVKEAKVNLKKGCKEIWLTAQDTGCYGLDFNSSLSLLLENIIQLPFEFKVRIGMMNPRNFLPLTERLLEFLHIPIQSGNDEILAKMNRQYRIAEVENQLSIWKQKFPDIAISIDVIVGYPSETDQQFEDTIAIIKKLQPDIVNISKFGARPKTPAAQLKPLPSHIIKERSTILSMLCNEIAFAQNLRYMQRNPTLRVLAISKGKKGGIEAHTDNYKPVILKENCELGKFYNVRLIEASQNYLYGVLI
jgi:threonylcarbamoyladenosine tRNA methylthiotransferase CDKAL1